VSRRVTGAGRFAVGSGVLAVAVAAYAKADELDLVTFDL